MSKAGASILDRLVGQDAARTRLVRAIRDGRLHHAYLLVGPPGVGKRMLARGAAQALLCTDRVDGRACGRCSGCGRVARGTHPDLHWLEPETETRRPATLGIDDVRRLIHEASWRPYEASWKVLVVAEADRLTPEAQNSLLKLLEEPPGTTLILLTTAAPDRLLPTVRSRCHPLVLRPLAEAEVRAVLEQHGPGVAAEAALLAVAAQGRPGRALTMDPSRAREQQALAREWVESLLAEPGWRRLARASELAERDDLHETLELAILWTRDLVLARSGAAIPPSQGEPAGGLAEAAARWETAGLISLWQALSEADRLVRGPAQRRLVLDRLALTRLRGGEERAG